MGYSVGKTIKKASIPLILVLLVRAAIAAGEAAGMKLDETQILTLAGAGYGAVIGLINWLKNRKKVPS
jgi:hypothetical protein